MKTDNGEDAGRPGTIGPVKIEWNWGLRQSLARDEEHRVGG